MRLFLTGGTGFIGSYVLDEALAAGHHVCALRRSSSSKPVIPVSGEPEWLDGCLSAVNANYFKNIDAVIHLASAGVSPKTLPWNELLESNVIGSLRLIEASAGAGVRRFLAAGTSHEYGTAADKYSRIPPDAPLEPLTPYGASKAAAFNILRAFSIEAGIELFYGRIFSAYGDGQFVGNFWPSLKRAALGGEDFSMTSGSQITDFIHVKEVAIHILRACTRTDIRSGLPLITNIGSGKARKLSSFAEEQWQILQAKGSLRLSALPDRPNALARCVPDLRFLYPTNSLNSDS